MPYSKRFSNAKKLLDYGFANYSFSEIGAELEETDIEIKNGVKKKVNINCAEKVNILLPKTQKSEIKREIQWNKNLTAPIKKDDVLGYVNVYSGDTQLGSLAITASEDVDKLTLWVTVGWILKGILTL